MRAFVLGGGPSLAGFDPERLRGRFVVAVKEAGLTLAPWADVLFWSDPEWGDRNAGRLHLHIGGDKVCRYDPGQRWGHTPVSDIPVIEAAFAAAGVAGVAHEKVLPFSTDPGRVAGLCSGGSALTLAAVRYGAREIVLLGFDGRANGWWHRHRDLAHPERYAAFAAAIDAMAPGLAAMGCRVLNATPGSAITAYPMIHLGDVL